MSDAIRSPLISSATIRIIGFQFLCLGLLFLPELSIFPLKWESAEYSLIMRTFQEIVDNPFFYGLLGVISVIMLFSFDEKIDESQIHNGAISLGSVLVKALSKVILIYSGLYIASWLFLVYKLRFMGDIYINSHLGGLA